MKRTQLDYVIELCGWELGKQLENHYFHISYGNCDMEFISERYQNDWEFIMELVRKIGDKNRGDWTKIWFALMPHNLVKETLVQELLRWIDWAIEEKI